HDKSYKKIEDIRVGDKILSVNTDTMQIEEDLVLIVPSDTETYTIIVMEFENGTVIHSSPHHPFYVKEKGWSVYDVDMANEDLSFSVDKIEVGDTVYYYENGILQETKLVKM